VLLACCGEEEGRLREGGREGSHGGFEAGLAWGG